jgi:TatD DNase family protein
MEAQPAKLRFIDSHAHLHLAAERLKLASFAELEAAMATHVASQPRFQLEAVVNVYCETDELTPGHSSHEVLRAANVFGAFGNHPHNASKWTDAVEVGLREVLKHEKCVAVGECGLDYHYMMSPKEDQLRVFRRHCEIAVELGLPLVVHSREAEEDTIAILTELVSETRDCADLLLCSKHAQMPRDWLIHCHCFTSSRNMAEQLLAAFPNLYIGFTGVVTFKNNADVLAALTAVPLNRLLLETDAPFMAPVPHRGKQCHSGHALHTAVALCRLKSVTEEEGFAALCANARRMYRLPV